MDVGNLYMMHCTQEKATNAHKRERGLQITDVLAAFTGKTDADTIAGKISEIKRK
jgi:hypothetical protein